MTKHWIVSSVLSGLLLVLPLQGLYAAPPQFPFSPYGTVAVNGENVPAGTEVGAWCGGVRYATQETFDFEGTSRYSIDIPGDDPTTSEQEGCLDGETVVFTLDGLTADQTAVWVEGNSTNVDLTAFRPMPALTLETTTNGIDADTPPGPNLRVSEAVTWDYHVTNTGNVTLTAITLTDDRLGAMPCPQTQLAVDAAMTCSTAGTVTAGQHANTATAQGTYESAVVSDTDPSHYFGVDPSIIVETTTNGIDADQSPGPYVLVDDPVTWRYTITNTSNATLTAIALTDNQLGTVSCPQTQLAAGAAMTCSASGTATAGQYANTATVTGTPPAGPAVSDTDTNHYFGAVPGITVEKTTNGVDADAAPGPFIRTGSTITWRATVTNTGNVTLTQVAVADDQEGVFACPETSLAPGAAMVCTITGSAGAGPYTNTATVTATPPAGPLVTDDDPSHYVGADPAISVTKTTNGQDADTTPGPYLLVGDAITWTYAITNTGNVTLIQIVVTDNQEGTIACPATTLLPDEAMRCEATSTAAAGQYANTVTASGTPPVGAGVFATDSSHYFGAVPGLAVEKLTNGVDGDMPPGAYILVGDTITWTARITNTGNVTLTQITATDDREGALTCPSITLAAGAAMTCSVAGTAIEGAYANQVTVTGAAPVGPPVTADDPSHYVGATPDLVIETATNGDDADSPTGPILLAGEGVTWTYAITNTGDVTLTAVTITDDQGVAVTCPATTLAAGAAMTCGAHATAQAGQYATIATVTGTPPGGLAPVSDTDPSHYFAYTPNPSIQLQTLTNDEDADQAPGPYLPLNTPPWFRFTLTNTGTTTVTALELSDTALDLTTCRLPTILAAGTAYTCTVAGDWASGQQVNAAAASAAFTDDAGAKQTTEAADVAYYYGSGPSIDVELTINSMDADAAPGPYIPTGEPVTWRYTITNTGNTHLSALSVTDQVQGAVTCSATTLTAGAVITCEITSTAEPGTYATEAVVTGRPPVGSDVTDSDPGHYFGVQAGVTLTSAINEVPASRPPGPWIIAGTAITLTYTATNTGNTILTDVAVVDTRLGAATCPLTMLEAGAGMTCTIATTAAPVSYTTTATVTGTPPAGPDATGGASAHYIGAALALQFEKAVSVDGSATWHDADQSPGPILQQGATPWFRFTLTNTGNVTLTALTLADDTIDVTGCELATSLPPQATTTCIRQGLATAGQQANVASAAGAFTDDLHQREQIAASDVAHYFGAAPGLTIEKEVTADGEGWHAADTDAGALPVDTGAQVWFRITVTNTGNVALTLVLDDRLDGVPLNLDTACSPPLPTALPGGGNYQCVMTSPEPAQVGLHRNVITATGYRDGIEVAHAVDTATYEARNVKIFLPLILRRPGP